MQSTHPPKPERKQPGNCALAGELFHQKQHSKLGSGLAKPAVYQQVLSKRPKPKHPGNLDKGGNPNPETQTLARDPRGVKYGSGMGSCKKHTPGP